MDIYYGDRMVERKQNKNDKPDRNRDQPRKPDYPEGKLEREPVKEPSEENTCC